MDTCTRIYDCCKLTGEEVEVERIDEGWTDEPQKQKSTVKEIKYTVTNNVYTNSIIYQS